MTPATGVCCPVFADSGRDAGTCTLIWNGSLLTIHCTMAEKL